jgi:hypothetical protein
MRWIQRDNRKPEPTSVEGLRRIIAQAEKDGYRPMGHENGRYLYVRNGAYSSVLVVWRED